MIVINKRKKNFSEKNVCSIKNVFQWWNYEKESHSTFSNEFLYVRSYSVPTRAWSILLNVSDSGTLQASADLIYHLLVLPYKFTAEYDRYALFPASQGAISLSSNHNFNTSTSCVDWLLSYGMHKWETTALQRAIRLYEAPWTSAIA